ncbi:hypothetical protein OsJ_12248 [Oryza sativa Japonica Group]|uniref:very-long-chain 3-oxoacyl-CoA synthase n=1 Tax=Oryza sativa subsp. japonica TaxID=39947 RepID=A3ALT7_ORYSJ|nr:hypothetical protein OsJ_12248 [Oryza sativa Japonica Group]
MAATALLRRARWALVDHPAVASFRWEPGRTPASTPSFAAAVICAYLATVFLLHRRVVPLPSPHPRALRAVSGAPQRGPPGALRRHGRRVYELGDTLLILLGRRPLTLLHVYHHAAVIAMCYLWLATRQSLMPIALATNAAVHVAMYGYYLCCSLGLRWPPRWKRAVTELQIAQFLFSFAASAVMLWRHFAAGGCEGMAGWAFNAVFNASLLALFLDFHGAAYAAAKGKKSRSEVVKEE